MRTSFGAALLTASLMAAPAFAQITLVPMPPAPAPTATGPSMGTGIPPTPLTAGDTAFLNAQLEDNMAEIQMGQLALQRSQDQNVRNYAQKMITDHTAANGTLMEITNRYGIQPPAAVSPAHQAMMARLQALNGLAFDTVYMQDMVAAHSADIAQLNAQLQGGQSQVINVWVQNTRPVVMQHEELAQRVEAVLPRTG